MCLASGHNVNVLVLDTEVYSNTGGQAIEGNAPGRGGQIRRQRQDRTPKKDLGLDGHELRHVYVAKNRLRRQG